MALIIVGTQNMVVTRSASMTRSISPGSKDGIITAVIPRKT